MAHSREEAAAKIAAREAQQRRAAGAGDLFSDEYQAAELARQEQKHEHTAEQVKRIEYETYVETVNALNNNPDYKGEKITPQTFEQWKSDGDALEAAAELPEPPAPVRPTKPRRSLSEAVQETLEEAPTEVEDPRVQGGSVLIRWGLFPDPENPNDPEAYTLGLAIHEEGVDEPDSVFLDITARMQHSWRKNQGEKVLERFAVGLIEKVIEKTSEDMGDALVAALHRITDGDLRKGKVRLVPDPEGVIPDSPENAGEVPEG